MIVEELIAHALAYAEGRTVTDARIGPGMTAVLLSDGACGLSFTLDGAGAHCSVLDEAGNIAGCRASEVVRWAMDTNPVRAGAGVAALNALLSPHAENLADKNAMDEIDIRPGDTVGMVGHFEPVLRQHGHRIGTLYVFERAPLAEGVYPDWAEDIYLPECDVVIVTGTTLINKTIDHVLSLCESAREVVLMGASATLCPDVFRAHGVHLLAGTLVTDANRALRVISEGGGTPQLRAYTRRVCVRL
jgi:uncharacterized protein (DUF4213/DUF364 family)